MSRILTDFAVKPQKMVWDPKTVEIRTRSVEKTLEPLVYQVTTLVNHSKNHKKGCSKRAPQLAKQIDLATTRLVQVGQSIANDFPEIKEHMLEACNEASIAGDSMRNTSREFASDPCNSSKRNSMIHSARAFLSAVTRLLCIADMADVYRLLAILRMVEDRLKELETVASVDELLRSFKNYGDDLMKLAKQTGLRQADLKDPRWKDEMAAARAVLKKSSRMLLTTSKVYVNHPDVKSAQLNRDYVMNQVSDAVSTIAVVAQAVGSSKRHPYEEVGFLASALEELMVQLDHEPEEFYTKEPQEELTALVEDITSGAKSLAESVCTRGSTRDRIYSECNNVHEALSTLIDEFIEHSENQPNDVEGARNHVEQKAKDLSKQLRKSVVDHVSDSFLEINTPLMLLIEAADSANTDEVAEAATVFREHATKLEEVATLACSMSGNSEGIKMVKLSAQQLVSLCPQVINAARTLSVRTNSKVAQENMNVFRDNWMHQVKILTEAVDDITTIDDFLTVTEARILEEVNRCVEAMKQVDAEMLGQTVGAVRGRILRVEHVVLAEMENYEPGPFTETVTRAVMVMKKNIMTQFVEHVDIVIDALLEAPVQKIDDEAFIDAARLVYEGMRDIRKAVQMRKPMEDPDSQSDQELENQELLLSKMADVQLKQRERLAYKQLKAGGKVQFEVHSEAADDPGYGGVSSIVVNGIEYCPRKRGHNVVVLNQVGTVVSACSFNTSDRNKGVAMARHLEDIPEEHVALIAVQESGGDGIDEAREALKNFGAVEPINPGHQSSWAFAGYKGDHQNKNWVSQISRPRYQGPAMISDMINTPASDMGKILIEIHAEACEDDPYMRISSVKVNSIERSPMGRGMNVVILDSAGNYLMSKNFDTADPYHYVGEGKRMAKFLDELPSERIVCVASLESVGDGINEAKDALLRIGAQQQVNPGQNGSYAFIGYTGPQEVTWLKQVTCSCQIGPAKINEFIVTPAAEAEVMTENTDELFSVCEPAAIDDYDFDRERLQSDFEQEYGAVNKQSARSMMRALPAEEKAKITKLAEALKMEKNRLITEVSKWDDQGNDIIVLAKKMCMIMMDMSDFTRGTGPLKTTMDVIKAAERIAKYGSQMNKLAGEIAEMCPHSHTRSDLLAYLQRIALYSHQLTITARVKSDVQTISGEIIISGVDSATSLIQAAKNLMNSVILTVKASYIASTKHKQSSDLQVVAWRMRAPEKKPLYKPETMDRNRPVRGTDVRESPVLSDALGDFH